MADSNDSTFLLSQTESSVCVDQLRNFEQINFISKIHWRFYFKMRWVGKKLLLHHQFLFKTGPFEKKVNSLRNFLGITLNQRNLHKFVKLINFQERRKKTFICSI